MLIFQLINSNHILFEMPFWSKKPTIDDQVIDLKMSAKTLNRQYKKCMDEATMYEKKMKAVGNGW